MSPPPTGGYGGGSLYRLYMTFVYGSRNAETSQWRRMIFITVRRKDRLSAATQTCSVKGYYIAREMESSRNELAALNVKYD